MVLDVVKEQTDLIAVVGIVPVARQALYDSDLAAQELDGCHILFAAGVDAQED
jgi:hypothetical protein